MSLVTANVWEIGSKQFPFCFRNIYEWIDHCKKGNLEWFDKNDTYWRDRWEWDIGINRDIWFDVSLSTLPFFVIRRNTSFSKVMITISYIAVISRKDYLKDVKNFHLIYCCCIIYEILKYNRHFSVLCFLFEIVMLFLVDSPFCNEVILVIWNWITFATFCALPNHAKKKCMIVILWNKIKCLVLLISYQVRCVV